MLKAIKKINIIKSSYRFISSHHVTADKAKEQFAVLTPYMDFKGCFSDIENLRKNLYLRKMQLNLDNLLVKYEHYNNIQLEKAFVEKEREEVVKQLKLISSHNDSMQEVNNLKTKGKGLKAKLKAIKEKGYTIEDDFIQDFLKLPNVLHCKVPHQEAVLIYRQGLPNKKLENPINHLTRNDLIDYKDDSCYYLLNDAAYFDTEFPINCVRYFTEKNYIQTSNPDFVRTILIEAASIQTDVFHQIYEDGADSKINLLHLAGGGSTVGFLGFLSKLSIYQTTLPLRLICSGRQYLSVNDTIPHQGLYTALQSNVVQSFVATETDTQADEEFEALLSLAIDIYKELDVHFRIVYLPAFELLPAESICASIQIYSHYYSSYKEIGRISQYNDFISKRILFNIKDKNGYRFPKIVGGTVVDVAKLIASLLENDKNLNIPIYGKSNKKDFFTLVNEF